MNLHLKLKELCSRTPVTVIVPHYGMTDTLLRHAYADSWPRIPMVLDLHTWAQQHLLDENNPEPISNAAHQSYWHHFCQQNFPYLPTKNFHTTCSRSHQTLRHLLRSTDEVKQHHCSTQTLKFLRATQQYEEWQREQGILDPDACLLAAIPNLRRSQPDTTHVWLGFPNPTPLVRRLMAACQETQPCILADEWIQSEHKAQVTLRMHEQEESLVDAMAQLMLADGLNGRTTAVVHPGFRPEAPASTHQATTIDAVSASLDDWHQRVQPWQNLFHSPRLADHPAIAATLLLPPLLENKFRQRDLRRLLTCSYFCRQEDWHETYRDNLAFLDWLAEHADACLSLSSLRTAIQHYSKHHGHPAQLLTLVEQLGTVKQSMSWGRWAEHWPAVLRQLGWPGHSRRPERDESLILAWHQSLRSLQILTPLIHSPSWTVFLEHYRIAIYHRLHTTSTPSPKDVLWSNWLSSPFQPSDTLILFGFDQERVTPRANPDPLLPVSFQQQCQLPQVSPRLQAEEDVATWSLAQGQYQNILVHCVQDSGHETLPLPFFITHHDHKTFEPERPTVPQPDRAALEFHKEDFRFDVTLCPDTANSGHLASQAACQFKGHCHWALQAQPAAQAQLGISPALRGSVIHDVLQGFWQEVRDQATLQHMPEDDIRALLAQQLEQAWKPYIKLHPHALAAQNRVRINALLENRLMTWLALELERPKFEIHSLEQPCELTIHNRTIRLRIDRIDRLEDGSLVIIDYKTGLCQPADWFKPRLATPQLPLYLLANDDDAQALYYGVIRQFQVALLGCRDESSEANGPQAKLWEKYARLAPFDSLSSWAELRELWKTQIDNLVDEMQSGQAIPAPLVAQACQHCAFTRVCRVHHNASIPHAEGEPT